MSETATAQTTNATPTPNGTPKPFEFPMPRVIVEDRNETHIIQTPRYLAVTLTPEGKLSVRCTLAPSEMDEVATALADGVNQIRKQKRIVPATFVPKMAP